MSLTGTCITFTTHPKHAGLGFVVVIATIDTAVRKAVSVFLRTNKKTGIQFFYLFYFTIDDALPLTTFDSDRNSHVVCFQSDCIITVEMCCCSPLCNHATGRGQPPT